MNDKKVLTDRQVRDLMERSVARSYGTPQGLSHLFPGLGSKRAVTPKRPNKVPRG